MKRPIIVMTITCLVLLRRARMVHSFVPRETPTSLLSAACYSSTFPLLHAKPKKGSIVDSYQTVSVNCSKCGERLFRYKKKNGTKSNLVKCYVERIADDCAGVLEAAPEVPPPDYEWKCPSCETRFARTSMIHGRPALKLVGGKIRMTKK